jgi:hypothetical protein
MKGADLQRSMAGKAIGRWFRGTKGDGEEEVGERRDGWKKAEIYDEAVLGGSCRCQAGAGRGKCLLHSHTLMHWVVAGVHDFLDRLSKLPVSSTRCFPPKKTGIQSSRSLLKRPGLLFPRECGGPQAARRRAASAPSRSPGNLFCTLSIAHELHFHYYCPAKAPEPAHMSICSR